LIVVEAEVVGPAGRATEARLVLDTGAAATTLTPRVLEKIGYTRRDGFKRAKVHTAIGEEHGYWIRVAEFTVLGVATPNFALTVFPLGHKGHRRAGGHELPPTLQRRDPPSRSADRRRVARSRLKGFAKTTRTETRPGNCLNSLNAREIATAQKG
jgi:hypothetical protein